LGLFQKGELNSERELGFRVVVNPKRRTAAAADHPRAACSFSSYHESEV
jgi:hypothetical protein